MHATPQWASDFLGCLQKKKKKKAVNCKKRLLEKCLCQLFLEKKTLFLTKDHRKNANYIKGLWRKKKKALFPYTSCQWSGYYYNVRTDKLLEVKTTTHETNIQILWYNITETYWMISYSSSTDKVFNLIVFTRYRTFANRNITKPSSSHGYPATSWVIPGHDLGTYTDQVVSTIKERKLINKIDQTYILLILLIILKIEKTLIINYLRNWLVMRTLVLVYAHL